MSFSKFGLLLLTLAISGGCSSAATARGGGENSPKETLRQKLQAASQNNKVMFGHHDDPVYGHTWSGDRGRSDVLETVGDYPAVMSWDLGGIELGDSLNLDGVPFSRIREEVIAQDARGGVNTFSWHLREPVNGGDSWTVSDSTVVAKMVNDSVANLAYHEQVRKAAAFFKSLKNENGEPVAVIFRPWHEHTGSWFWWGTDLCTPDNYKKLWKILREEMDKAGVDNLLYAYSPDRVQSEAQYMERYPGDEYVDIIGADIYHFNAEHGLEDYQASAAKALGIVKDVAQRHGKIPAFTETGSEGLPMAEWWTEVLLPILRENQVSYVVVWRNAHDKPGHFYAPFPGQKSESSFKKFHSDPSILFLKDLKNQ